MKLLTDEQKLFFLKRNLKVGHSYMFPQWGFYVYDNPNFINGSYLDTNPFTKSLGSQLFKIYGINELTVYGNFESRPIKNNFYIEKFDLEKRGFLEALLLFIFCSPFFVIYNFFKSKTNKDTK